MIVARWLSSLENVHDLFHSVSVSPKYEFGICVIAFYSCINFLFNQLKDVRH